MAILFISDLHLAPQFPDTNKAFIHFLQHQGKQAEQVYILGDLFEFWLGDDDLTPFNQEIIAAISQLAHTTPTFFMHGNRDFLIGKQFAQQTGCILLPDPTVVDIYGQKVLISHGDLFCTDDIAYQRFRRFAHNKLLQWIFTAIPLSWRHKIANQARNQSKAHTRTTQASIMDVNDSAVAAVMTRHQVTTLIHGHTHRPNFHQFTLSGKSCKRIVLSDWDKRGSMLVCLADGSMHFERVLP